jgi:nitrogen fixation-related uncharacterized protein
MFIVSVLLYNIIIIVFQFCDGAGQFSDKAYDSRKIFNILDANGTNAIILLRHSTARQIRKVGEENLGRIHNYGRR